MVMIVSGILISGVASILFGRCMNRIDMEEQEARRIRDRRQ